MTISASANASTASATLTVTAQARPPAFVSDVDHYEGSVCGATIPASRGEYGILYRCGGGDPKKGLLGTCTFSQECSLGCRSEPVIQNQFNDRCASDAPFPVALAPPYLVGGGSSAGTILLSAPAPQGSVVGATTNSLFATVTSVDPLPAGATSASFTVSTRGQPEREDASRGSACRPDRP